MAARNGLRDLKLETRYRSSDHEILHDFYIPCLSRALMYDRAVGYFTSSSLEVAARGLEAFQAGGGVIRLVASAVVSERDAIAIDLGYKLRARDADNMPMEIERILLRALEAPNERLVIALRLLAWYVAEGVLDIKIAVPTGPGIYHEKFGYFTDSSGGVVAFQGSPNETAEG